MCSSIFFLETNENVSLSLYFMKYYPLYAILIQIIFFLTEGCEWKCITLLGLFIQLSALSGCNAGKVLVVPAYGSHWINMKTLIVELHSKDHNITVVQGSRSWYIEDQSPLYTSITVDSGKAWRWLYSKLSPPFTPDLETRKIVLERNGTCWRV